jgi:uncharacterized phage-associated protein
MDMPVSAHDVARELRALMPLCGAVKLHKLLYMCQGWHLAWYGAPLFEEDLEAWENGPVVADVWRDEKDGRRPPSPEPLPSSGLLVVDFVFGRYGSLSGRDLIELTHSEGPWTAANARAGAARVITTSELREFFAHAEREDEAEVDYRYDDAAVRAMVERSPHPAAGPGDLDEADEIRRWVDELIS